LCCRLRRVLDNANVEGLSKAWQENSPCLDHHVVWQAEAVTAPDAFAIRSPKRIEFVGQPLIMCPKRFQYLPYWIKRRMRERVSGVGRLIDKNRDYDCSNCLIARQTNDAANCLNDFYDGAFWVDECNPIKRWNIYSFAKARAIGNKSAGILRQFGKSSQRRDSLAGGG
jgi:hypothetical protein